MTSLLDLFTPPPMAQCGEHWAEPDVVARRIDSPLSHVASVLSDGLARGGHGELLLPNGWALRFDGPFVAAWCGVLDGWRAEACLISTRSRCAPSYRVIIEIAPWSDHTSELTILLRYSRATQRWGRRRLDRYFEVAHHCADDLVEALSSELTCNGRREIPFGLNEVAA
jgi:hypothetical protein